MAGRMMFSIFFMFLATLYMLLMITYSEHEKYEEIIDSINYNTCEIIATKGKLTQQLYDELMGSISKYGDFTVKLRYDKQIKPGVYDTFYDEDEIIEKDFKIGDKITIYLEDKNLSLFGRFINASFFGLQPESFLNERIKSIKTIPISKNSLDNVPLVDTGEITGE